MVGKTGPLQTYADEVLSGDFLSPVLATMLIPDAAACLLHGEWAEDRASTLERAFELSWWRTIRTGTFEGPLDALWAEELRHRLPSLFLNSTEADTGQRIVNSHVILDPELSPALSLPRFTVPRSLRVSTSVLLSARFPAISPIGSLGSEPESGTIHIVDGGYVDNSGALTASEVATALHTSAARLGLRDKIRTVAVVITDDPVRLSDSPSDHEKPGVGLESTAAGALLSAFETLDNVRSALATKHRESLRELVHSHGGEVIEGFALRASPIEFPLGWMLSSTTRAALTQQIGVLKAAPRGPFQRIRQLLSPGRVELR
ncbi:MAG: hypothetical protein U0790_21795 [Isosphaeraceae bacterium]